MTSPVVGHAAVVIEADLSRFGDDARRGLEDRLNGLGPTVDEGLRRAGEGAGDAGQNAGRRAGEGMNNGIRGAGPGAGNAGDQTGARAGQGFATGLRGHVQRGIAGLRQTLSGQVGDLAKVAAGAFAVDKVKDFFSDAIDEATESQKVNAQTATTLKATGEAAGVSAGQIGDLATEISNYAGIDDEAVQAGENLLLNFKNIHNSAGRGNDIFSRATKIATDYSVATGTALPGAMRTFGKALNDPLKGMGALAKAGVSFTTAQKDQVKAMVASGNTLGAQKILLGQLEARYKGSAAAQATAGEKAAVAWGNFKEQVGGILLPIIAKVSNFLTTNVIPALAGVVDWLSRNGETIKTVALVLSPLVALWAAYVVQQKAAAAITAIQAAWTKGLTIATTLQGIAINAVALATRVWTAAQWLFNAAMSANPIGLVVLAVAALAAGVIYAYKHSETFRDIIQSAFHVVSVVFHTVYDFIKKWGIDIASFILGPVGVLIVLWRHSETFRDIVRGAFQAVGDAARWLWHTGVEAPARGITTALGWISDAAGRVATWIGDKVDAIVGFVTGLPRRIAHVASDMYHAGLNLMQKMLDGIADALGAIGGWATGIGKQVVNAIIGFINSDVIGGINDLLEIHISMPGPIPDIDINPPDIPGIPTIHAKGGNLTGFDLVGDAGPELILNRTVVSNPGTAGGNFDAFANAIVDKLGSHSARAGGGQQPLIGELHLHYPKPDTIDRGIATAMRNASMVIV